MTNDTSPAVFIGGFFLLQPQVFQMSTVGKKKQLFARLFAGGNLENLDGQFLMVKPSFDGENMANHHSFDG